MEELPRKGSALFNLLRGDNETTKKSLRNWKKLNKAVIFLYELGLLPLIGAGWYILLLYTKGRKSGKIRVTPLEYRRRRESVLIFSARGKRSDWYKNLKMNPDDVKLRIGFKTHIPRIDLIEDADDVKEILGWYVKKNSRSSKMLFGWDAEKDRFETTDLSLLINTIKIVKLSFNE
jgi:deazaflavin-dependent oxidoreductase (nitroreductase family)